MTNFASIFIQTKCHQKRKTGERECGNERNICTTTSNWGRHSEERQKIIRIQTETDIIKANAIPSINNELLAKEIVNQQKDCCEKKHCCLTITTGKNVTPLSVDSFILEQFVMVPKPVLNVQICRFNLANQIEM